MRSFLFTATALVTTVLATGSKIEDFRRLSEVESEELNQICGEPSIDEHPGDSQYRISFGHAAVQGEFPWAVRLILSQGNEMFSCSASIISKYHVVTAAHCFIENQIIPGVFSLDLRKSFVLGGSTCAVPDMQDYEHVECEENDYEKPRKLLISKIIVPKSSLVANRKKRIAEDPDIAIVELGSPINETDFRMMPICLPTDDTDAPLNYVQYGFGKTEKTSRASVKLSNAQLRKLYLSKQQLVSSVQCFNILPEAHYERVLPVFIPPGRRLVCDGDSGGALSGALDGQYFLFGVLSSATNKTCGLYEEKSFLFTTKLTCYTDFLCFYTGVCPLGYDVYMDKNYAKHPEAVIFLSEESLYKKINEESFIIPNRPEGKDATPKPIFFDNRRPRDYI